MIRNLAVTIVVLGLIVFFQSHIKAFIMETQNAAALSRVELTIEKKDQLRQALDRIAKGYARDVYTDVEIITLQEQLAELRGYSGKEMEPDKADFFMRRFETILARHKL